MLGKVLPLVAGLGFFAVSVYFYVAAGRRKAKAHQDGIIANFKIPKDGKLVKPQLPDLLDLLSGFNKQSVLTATGPAVQNLRKAVEKAENVPPLSETTLHAHLEVLQGVKNESGVLLSKLTKAFEGSKGSEYTGARSSLQALQSSVNLMSNLLMQSLPAAAGRESLGKQAEEAFIAHSSGASSGSSRRFHGSLTVTVNARPFGMNVHPGTATVDEVFPSFPAHEAGVKRGCVIQSIDDRSVDGGTWLEAFRHAKIPFQLHLNCKDQGSKDTELLHVSEDPTKLRALVLKKPFGMNVQVNHLPRVVEVLPGYPAESTGVKRGHVLISVAEKPVDISNWFQAFQDATPPFTLTFDTTVPLHADNPYFFKNPSEDHSAVVDMKNVSATLGADHKPLVPLLEEEMQNVHLEAWKQGSSGSNVGKEIDWKMHEEFTCTVSQVPFGMQIAAKPGDRPRVVKVLEGFPALKVGVKQGDVLLEVAGLAVSFDTWFSHFQQGVPPFGLRFARPKALALPGPS